MRQLYVNVSYYQQAYTQSTTQLYLSQQQEQQLQKQIQELTQQVVQTQQSLKDVVTEGTWKMQQGIATAYSPFENLDGNQAEGEGNVTSVGLYPNENVIAVDPAKIPYGSNIVLIYPDGQIKKGIAGDTGGALRASRGYHVDVFRSTYEEAEAHGVKNVMILWQPKR